MVASFIFYLVLLIGAALALALGKAHAGASAGGSQTRPYVYDLGNGNYAAAIPAALGPDDSYSQEPVVDTYVASAYPTTSYCSSTSLHVSYDVDEFNYEYWERAYLGFDLSSIPANATISSAIFYAYLTAASGDTSVPIELRRVTDHPFGAVLVGPTGEVLAEAENSVVTDLDCTAHAELNLIRLASHRLDVMTLAASTLYASTEPCAMCAGAIHWSGIGRLVYGLAEERLYELSSANPADRPLNLPCREVLRRCARPIEIVGPALESEAEQVHRGFWGPAS